MMYFLFFLSIRQPPRSTRTDTLFPYTTLLRYKAVLNVDPAMNASMPKLVPCSSILTLLCFFCSRPLLTQTGGMSRRAILHYEGSFRSSPRMQRSEEHTSELQSLMRISYAVFCLKKKNRNMQ